MSNEEFSQEEEKPEYIKKHKKTLDKESLYYFLAWLVFGIVLPFFFTVVKIFIDLKYLKTEREEIERIFKEPVS